MDVNTIFNIAITIILGLVAYLYRQSEERISELENKLEHTQTNFYTKFAEVNKNINELRIETLNAFKNLEIKILEKDRK